MALHPITYCCQTDTSIGVTSEQNVGLEPQVTRDAPEQKRQVVMCSRRKRFIIPLTASSTTEVEVEVELACAHSTCCPFPLLLACTSCILLPLLESFQACMLRSCHDVAFTGSASAAPCAPLLGFSTTALSRCRWRSGELPTALTIALCSVHSSKPFINIGVGSSTKNSSCDQRASAWSLP